MISKTVLSNGVKKKTITGGDGDDVIRQEIERVDDTLIGGLGVDTVDYGVTNLNGKTAVGIVANLATGRVTKVFAGTSVDVGVKGRYIRIYHTGAVSATQALTLTGLKVFAGGVDVAAGRPSAVGADGGSAGGGSYNNPWALTDGAVGGAWNGGSRASTSNLANVTGTKAYIELDLGSVQAIDSIALWGHTNVSANSNNLRVYVSNTAFDKLYTSAATAYANLAANTAVARVDVAVVDTAPSTTFTDTLSGVENLVGTALADSLMGDGKDNVLSGGAGDDTLSGGAGKDVINGGDGNDRILQDIERVSDTLNGGNGTDTVDYGVTYLSGIASTGITANLAAGKVTKVFAGTSVGVGTTGRYIRIYHTDAVSATQALTLTGMKVFAGGVDVAAGRQSAVGADGGSVGGGTYNNPRALTDGAVGGAWNGGSTSSTSNLAHVGGKKGYIELDLGSVQAIGSIALWGHTNVPANSNNLRVYVSNTAFISSATAYANLAANTAVARVDVAVVDTAPSTTFTDTLSGIENLVGTALADSLTGDGKDNVLSGGAGNDTLNGGAGSDTMSGGVGDDIYVVTDAGDVVQEKANEGIDTIWTRVNYALSNTSEVENLMFDGIGNFIGSGNALNNLIAGGTGNDRLIGGAGNDTLNGGDGTDTADYTGVAGNLVANLITGKVNKVLSSFGAKGLTTVTSTDTLSGIENLVGTAQADSVTGDAKDNTLSGGADNDTLNGGAGNDTLAGGAGIDVVNGGDGDDVIVQDMERSGDTLNGGNGTDTVDYGATNLVGITATGIVANLGANVNGTGAGTVTKIFAGTSVGVGAAGRYIRIYHTDSVNVTFPLGVLNVLSLTGLKVFEGGIDVAAGRPSVVGADGGLYNAIHNPAALTDGVVGGGWNLSTANKTNNMAYVSGTTPYIELDLGRRRVIDSVALWGRADAPIESNGLRVYVSSAPFPRSATAYRDLAANVAVARVDVGMVDTAATTALTDTVLSVENVIGTALADTLTGDAKDNALSGGAGNDTLNGGAGNDVLAGGADADSINGGDGDDLIVQGMERGSDTLNGGGGTDTVDYSSSGMAGGIVANLATGKVQRVFAGTTVGVGATGRYIRIYHMDAVDIRLRLTLTGLKVYAGGIDIAAGKPSLMGVDRGSFIDSPYNNPAALTDDSVGGPWNNLGQWSGTPSNLAYVSGTQAYIELDLGSVQAIDSMALWGELYYADDGSNLRVYVSKTPFVSSATAYADLAANTAVARVDVASVDTAASTTFTDTLSAIENLIGTARPDTLIGNGSSNVMSGGGGNDTLAGGAGSDTYVFGRGGGSDVVQENDATAGNKDVLRFGTSIDASQIWLRKVNSDLELSLIGTSDRVTVTGWYTGSSAHVEEIYAGGKKLLDTNVDKLVSAMAAFAPPAAGQTSLPANLQPALQPVIAANWTAA